MVKLAHIRRLHLAKLVLNAISNEWRNDKFSVKKEFGTENYYICLHGKKDDLRIEKMKYYCFGAGGVITNLFSFFSPWTDDRF